MYEHLMTPQHKNSNSEKREGVRDKGGGSIRKRREKRETRKGVKGGGRRKREGGS